MIHGIDVSAYQSATYSTSGLDFVFTKITEGLSYVNPRWVQQRDRAKAAGLVWGAYHYPHMAHDPKAEADYFLKQVAWKPGDLIALDWEGYDSANRDVPHSRMIAYRDAWLRYVKGKMPAHRVGMYCNTDYWRNVDNSSNCGDFLWIATAGLPAGQPGIAHPWTIHQYSTAGGVDHDVANFPTRAALAAWAAGTTPSTEDDMPLTDADALKLWSYSHGDTPDVHQTLATAAAQATAAAAGVNALAKKVAALEAQPLTDAQITQIAAAVAASPALADRIADTLAARLKD